MKKQLILLAFLSSFPLMSLALGEYNPQSVGAGNPEVHIKSDGMITVRSAHVEQVVGSTFYIVAKWGSLPMSFTMKTDRETSVVKRYGGNASVSEMKLGDYIDVDGEFFVGSDFFGMNAKQVKDWSLQEESGTFSGVITEVNPSGTFMLRTTQNQTITVKMGVVPVIKKGGVQIPFERLQKGDAVPLAGGVYDYAHTTLTADKITVYQAKTDFLPRNFEGTLKKISSTDIPSTLVVTVNSVDYTINVNQKTAILKKNKSVGQLARFVAGDTIRFYGGVREEEKTLNDSLVVDAEIVRNLSL